MKHQAPNALTLDTLGEVAEVEDVVGLGGRGQEVGAHAEIDVHSGRHDGLTALTHGVGEVHQEPGQDGLQTHTRHLSVTHVTCQSHTSFVCRTRHLSVTRVTCQSHTCHLSVTHITERTCA